MSRPTNSSLTQPSFLEAELGFTDPTFRQYMAVHNTPARLRPLAEEMAASTTPAVQSAAGWAYAEMAVRQRDAPNLTQAAQDLATAEALWSNAAAGLRQQRPTAPSARVAQALFRLEQRAHVAVASVRLMAILAIWSADIGTVTSQQDIADAVQTMRAATLNVGRSILETTAPALSHARQQLIGELATLLLLQTPQAPFFTVPANIRTVYARNAARRSHASAALTAPPHLRTRIEVNHSLTPSLEDSTYKIIVYTVIHAAPPRGRTSGTLRALIDQEQGTLPAEAQATLGVLRQDLTNRILASFARRDMQTN